MLKDKFLIKITTGDLYAFHQNYMAGDDTYELSEQYVTYLNPDTNENISMIEITKAVTAVQKLIMLFAQNELGMNPVKLYFPREKVEYLNSMTILNQIAAGWKQQGDLVVSLDDLPEYITQYDALTVINSASRLSGLKEGIGIAMLNSYFEGGVS